MDAKDLEHIRGMDPDYIRTKFTTDEGRAAFDRLCAFVGRWQMDIAEYPLAPPNYCLRPFVTTYQAGSGMPFPTDPTEGLWWSNSPDTAVIAMEHAIMNSVAVPNTLLIAEGLNSGIEKYYSYNKSTKYLEKMTTAQAKAFIKGAEPPKRKRSHGGPKI